MRRNPDFLGLIRFSRKINSHSWEFSIDRLVSVGQYLLATGHPRHVVTTIDKSIAIRANAYESMEESSNDIRHKPTVLVEIGGT